MPYTFFNDCVNQETSYTTFCIRNFHLIMIKTFQTFYSASSFDEIIMNSHKMRLKLAERLIFSFLKIKSVQLLCVFMLLCFCNSHCQHTFFIAERFGTNYSKCITNSSFALSGIEEDAPPLNEVSRYLPERKTNDFDCAIASKDNRTKNFYEKGPWSLNQSRYQRNIDEIILDRRWEEMKALTTRYRKHRFQDLEYKSVLSNLTDDFEIPLSIRTEREAHLFLCDGVFPPYSNCYWFLLQAFSGERSAIRKCRTGDIPAKRELFPVAPCSTLLNKIEHPDFPLYLSSKRWSHFKLVKKSNHLSFIETDGFREKTILEWTDPKGVINVTYLTIHSKQVNAFWKIHQVEYIYTNQESKETPLGAPISSIKGSVCISMFVSMCQSCRLKLTLTKRNRTVGEKFICRQHPGWSEIKFLVENQWGSRLQLLVSTFGASRERFWAIDDVRQCQKNEFRSITLTEKAACQLMVGENNVISLGNTPNSTGNNCPKGTTGEFCVPCKWIYDDCEGIKTHSRSSAGAFYRGRGTIFAKAPEATKADYRKVTIRVINFEVLDVVDNDQPKSYSIQYKKLYDSDENWNCFGSAYRFYKNETIEIDNLEVGTRYFVRCVITTSNGITYIDSRTPIVEFTTRCEDSKVELRPSNTSVIVSFIKQTTELACNNEEFKVRILGIVRNAVLEADSSTVFNHLNPFTNYTLIIETASKRYNRTFQTTEGIPRHVQNLVITNTSSSHVGLKWYKPPSIYGKLLHYIVEYEHLSYVSCNETTKKGGLLRVNETSAVINGLFPYSLYNFTVSAVNSKFKGQSLSLLHATLFSSKIQQEEIPENINIVTNTTADTTAITVSWNTDCTKLRGPLLAGVTLTCFTKWCRNLTQFDIIKNETFLLKLLTPFSDYKFELKFCRNNLFCSDVVQSRQFKTKPTAPHEVNELLVYSKSEDSVSLRWKPPYPPTGILENYQAEIFDHKSGLPVVPVVFTQTSCKLWPEFHCHKLKNFSKNGSYTIKISAKNENPNTFGLPSSVNVTTKIEKSEAPYDLKLNWTLENNLKLEWKHPNQSNGEIQFFAITITNDAIPAVNAKLNLKKGGYNLTYRFEVEAMKLLPSTRYQIAIAAFNRLPGKLLRHIDTSPPDTPSLRENPQFSSSKGTITVKISPSQPRGIQDNYICILLITEQNNTSESHSEFRIVSKCNLTDLNETYSITIGRDEQLPNCDRVKNPPLESGVSYNITVILISTFQGKSRQYMSTHIVQTSYTIYDSVLVLVLLILLLLLVFLLIGIATTALIFRKRYQITKFSSKSKNGISSYQMNYNENYDAEGVNTENQILSKIVQLSNFELYVKRSEEKREFERQHAMVLKKERIYEIVDGNLYFDYIDMEYIHNRIIPRAYAATEMPTPDTIDDFWKAIWDDNVRLIVLVGNPEKAKFKKYWPEKGSMKCHSILIQFTCSETSSDFEFRTFSLTCNNEQRKVDQIHHPYCGLNPQKFVSLFKKLSKIALNPVSPICIHNSDGVRETGLVLLCDMSLRMAQEEGAVDVLRNLQRLNDQNTDMVDNVEHYKMAHFIISEYFFGTKSTEFVSDYANF